MAEDTTEKQNSWDTMNRHDKAGLVHSIVNGIALGIYDEDESMRSKIDKLRNTPGIPQELKSLDGTTLQAYSSKFERQYFPEKKYI